MKIFKVWQDGELLVTKPITGYDIDKTVLVLTNEWLASIDHASPVKEGTKIHITHGIVEMIQWIDGEKNDAEFYMTATLK